MVRKSRYRWRNVHPNTTGLNFILLVELEIVLDDYRATFMNWFQITMIIDDIDRGELQEWNNWHLMTIDKRVKWWSYI